MKLNEFKSYNKKSKRLGRGRATGKGKTSGRGHKGQKARAGKKLRPGFEGGQTPIFQRLPKYRGFTNPNQIDYQVINVSQLEALGEKTIDKDILLKHRLIRRLSQAVKILGHGDLGKSLKISVEAASQSALDKISKAGGSFTSTKKEVKHTHKQWKAESSEDTAVEETTAEK